MPDITMGVDETLELDEIIEEWSRSDSNLSFNGDKDSFNLSGIQTKTSIINPQQPGTYTITVNGRELSVEVIGTNAIPDSDVYWPMNDGSGQTLTDEQGSRDLSLTGGSWDGDVLALDGTDDYGTNGDAFFDGLGDFGIFGWLRMDSTDGGAVAGSYDTSGDNRSWWIGMNNSQINVNTSTEGADFSRHDFSTSLSSETWYSVAVNRQSDSGDVEVFRNASSLNTVSLDTGTLYDNGLGIFVGQRGDGAFFGGNTRSFAFVKGRTFSSTEIQDFHDATDPR